MFKLINLFMCIIIFLTFGCSNNDITQNISIPFLVKVTKDNCPLYSTPINLDKILGYVYTDQIIEIDDIYTKKSMIFSVNTWYKVKYPETELWISSKNVTKYNNNLTEEVTVSNAEIIAISKFTTKSISPYGLEIEYNYPRERKFNFHHDGFYNLLFFDSYNPMDIDSITIKDKEGNSYFKTTTENSFGEINNSNNESNKIHTIKFNANSNLIKGKWVIQINNDNTLYEFSPFIRYDLYYSKNIYFSPLFSSIKTTIDTKNIYFTYQPLSERKRTPIIILYNPIVLDYWTSDEYFEPFLAFKINDNYSDIWRGVLFTGNNFPQNSILVGIQYNEYEEIRLFQLLSQRLEMKY